MKEEGIYENMLKILSTRLKTFLGKNREILEIGTRPTVLEINRYLGIMSWILGGKI